jgi:Fe-S cluster assembly iron-binding protein IscA
MFNITDKAVKEFKTILAGEDMPEVPGLRVYAQSGGCCSSEELGVEIADMSEKKALDFDGLQVHIDEDAAEIAQKATIDFFEDPENPGFRVLWQKKEAAKNGGGCGCGC